MNPFQRLKRLVLPELIDFFEELTQQSLLTSNIIQELFELHTQHHYTDTKKLRHLIDIANKGSRSRMNQLENVFITPVDREAISRAYAHLHWIALSTKHLVVELETYEIKQLNDCKRVVELLNQEMTDLQKAFASLGKKDSAKTMKKVADVIHADNQLIKEYAKHLKLLFKEKDMEHVLQQREILSQLKEISKRIHFCANQVEDIVFKMN